MLRLIPEELLMEVRHQRIGFLDHLTKLYSGDLNLMQILIMQTMETRWLAMLRVLISILMLFACFQ